MNPISLLVWLLVAVIVIVIAKYIMDLCEVPRPVRTVVLLVIALLCLLWLLRGVVIV